MANEKATIYSDTGNLLDAVEPIIVSASRSTDIPAFYSDWLMNRLERGYVAWMNPFNRKVMAVSFSKTRLIVFWSKNPQPMLKHLSALDKRGINFYFQFTLNDYVDECLEPNVPALKERIETFVELSKRVGKERVIWRFDPLMISSKLPLKELLQRIKKIGNALKGATEKLVVSFADIEVYRKVRINLGESDYREMTRDECLCFAQGLSDLNANWGFDLATCAEEIDLTKHGITHNKCIDDDLMVKLFSADTVLMDFIGAERSQSDLFMPNSKPDFIIDKSKKDKGQRKSCGCIISKDIGEYNTCPHLCRYCYANSTSSVVLKNWQTHQAIPFADRIIQ